MFVSHFSISLLGVIEEVRRKFDDTKGMGGPTDEACLVNVGRTNARVA